MASSAEPPPTGETKPAQAKQAQAKPARVERRLAGPLTLRLGAFVVAVAVTALGAWLGAWWVPFVVGLAAGALGRAAARRVGVLRAGVPRGAVLPAAAGAIIGWLIPLWALALDGQPVGATARVIAALAGLPPYAGVAVTVVALLAALQVLAGAWLARGVIPRRSVAQGVAQERQQPEAGTSDVNIGQA
jgi:hypothetical protein